MMDPRPPPCGGIHWQGSHLPCEKGADETPYVNQGIVLPYASSLPSYLRQEGTYVCVPYTDPEQSRDETKTSTRIACWIIQLLD
jgi:hypothetical protein